MFKKLGIINILEIIGIIGALIFSYLAYNQSNEAIKISTKEIAYAEAENSPILKVKMEYFYEENDTKLIYTKTNIINDGEKIRSYEISYYDFIVLESCFQGFGCYEDNIPIKYFSTSNFDTSNTQGKLSEIYYSKNSYSEYIAWERKMYKIDKENSPSWYIDPRLKILIDVFYEDIHREKKHKYFWSSVIGSPSSIESESAKKLIAKHLDSVNMKTVNEITYEDLNKTAYQHILKIK